ncbi:MAG: nuclear transport factor 2 family protein, partial [Hyphomicrobiaceae bacterium]
MAEQIVIDTRSDARGAVADWVAVFADVWKAPRERLDRLMALLDEDVVLKAPTTPPVSRGKAHSRRAFEQAFRVMPDLSAEIHQWSTDNDALFVEMSFSATNGGRVVTWRNVDRILFRNGSATERMAFFNPARVRRAFL